MDIIRKGENMAESKYKIKSTKNLSPRIQWLWNYYWKGNEREWNNDYHIFGINVSWDLMWDEVQWYIAAEMARDGEYYATTHIAYKQAARFVDIPNDFWHWSLPERRAWFFKEVMVNYIPQEILPGDLIAGARFNTMISRCLTKEEAEEHDKDILGENGIRAKFYEYHFRGFGNLTTAQGHIIPDHETPLRIGFKGIFEDLEQKYNNLIEKDKKGKKGAQLRAMMTAATLPRDLAAKYSKVCEDLAKKAKTQKRRDELLIMADNLKRVPWEGAKTFWEAVMSLWITHMLILAEESYPGPGTSFGRMDQYLYPYWEKSIEEGMDPEFGKEILKCFWIHCNTAYDANMKSGNNQGIMAAFGQLFNISGVGKDGLDMTNDLTYAILDVIDDLSPILEPKPNVRLHRNSPDELLERVVDMLSTSQGAPFLLNFDERSMAGMMREAKRSGQENLINLDNVFDYASVGCLENTMVGNDRSGTVDNNLVLLKAVDLTLNDGKDLIQYTNSKGIPYPEKQEGPKTGDPRSFKTFDEFYSAFEKQMSHIVKKNFEFFNQLDNRRAKYLPEPYLSCLVKGCADKGKDLEEGGAELSFSTIEGVSFATTVDSLLAVKYLVFDKKECTMDELIKALKANWRGYEILQAKAKNKAPKYGRDDDTADALGQKVMDLWTDEVWKYKTDTGTQLRPGMLSWNYWIAYGPIIAASPDGRIRGQFLSNAICPTDGADINGPTSNTNSVGKVLGGRDENNGDYFDYRNCLPNGASHTITFNPAIVKDPTHKVKFKAFLRGYIENGGTALQVNMLDADMLRDAQKHPENYKNLLVRITGYNAYFTSIGTELQNEVIARLSHEKY